jgi:hypothetical protein
MNPVTASATFHIGQFLEDIVGVATTRGDMSATFPTKMAMLHTLQEQSRDSIPYQHDTTHPGIGPPNI